MQKVHYSNRDMQSAFHSLRKKWRQFNAAHLPTSFASKREQSAVAATDFKQAAGNWMMTRKEFKSQRLRTVRGVGRISGLHELARVFLLIQSCGKVVIDQAAIGTTIKVKLIAISLRIEQAEMI